MLHKAIGIQSNFFLLLLSNWHSAGVRYDLKFCTRFSMWLSRQWCCCWWSNLYCTAWSYSMLELPLLSRLEQTIHWWWYSHHPSFPLCIASCFVLNDAERVLPLETGGVKEFTTIHSDEQNRYQGCQSVWVCTFIQVKINCDQQKQTLRALYIQGRLTITKIKCFCWKLKNWDENFAQGFMMERGFFFQHRICGVSPLLLHLQLQKFCCSWMCTTQPHSYRQR